MTFSPPRHGFSSLVLCLAVGGAAAGACGGSGDSAGGDQGGGARGGSNALGGVNSLGGNGQNDGNGVGASGPGEGASGEGGGTGQTFEVTPMAAQKLALKTGTATPSVTYQATANGQPVSVGWSVDRGELGSLSSFKGSSTVFTPSGAAGTVTLTAGYNKQKVTRQIVITVAATQNGASADDTAHDVNKGGGVGGVGGEGVGVGLDATKDAATLMALANPSDPKSQSLRFLYPYDGTVFPRGVFAPLLQWDSSLGDADGVAITLKTSDGSYTYAGTFGRPAALAGGKFVRHPIPIDAWQAATNTAGGATTLTVGLTVAKGGIAYGPITQTYTIAPARLTGTVYYNSYGTSFVQNWSGHNDTAGHEIGAAILGIRSGDTGPHVVVGETSTGDDSGCRVCHIVNGGGTRIITQSEQGNPGDGKSFFGDLTTTATGPVPTTNVDGSLDGTFGWAAMTHDGQLALTNTLDPSGSNHMVGSPASKLFTLGTSASGVTPTDVTSTVKGWPAGLGAGYPAFSPDDKHVVFSYAGGPAIDAGMVAAVDPGSGAGRFSQLVAADFDRAGLALSNLRLVAPAPAGQKVGYGTFFPGSDALIYQVETASANGNNDQAAAMVTRNGARGELWWATLTSPSPVALATLNGKNAGGTYLPTGVNNHADETTLDYEPTINPVSTGGYAWVVFTSRRLYGNVAVTDPWASDPQTYNLQDPTQAPTKKLWVAAIDLDAKPGTDPSHPAFYLPAQELTAGNSRGFWALDPCRQDSTSCDSGDECCGGFCQPDATSGALVCQNKSNTNNCSMPQEKCTSASDCCDASNLCIGGYCAIKSNGPH